MKYSIDEKRKLVLRYQNGESVTDICTETGIARSTLYSWIKSHQTISNSTITPKEVMLLKKRLEKLEGIIAVLKTVDCTVSSPLQGKLKALENCMGVIAFIPSAMRWKFRGELSIITFYGIRGRIRVTNSGGFGCPR